MCDICGYTNNDHNMNSERIVCVHIYGMRTAWNFNRRKDEANTICDELYFGGVFVKEDRRKVSKKLDADKFLVGQSDRIELTGKYVRCHLQQRFTFSSELF